MFDMSWGEIMVIGGVALIVIGPKDLPKALRTVGQMTTKVRRMAGEFQSQFSEAMREAELDDVRKEVEGLNRDVATATSTAFNPLQSIRDEIKTSADTRPGALSPSAYEPGPAGPDLPVAGDWSAGPSELTAGPLQDRQPTAFDEPAMPDPIVPALPPMAEPASPVAGPAGPAAPVAGPAAPVAGPAAPVAFPETQPLVPLPVDEPVLPSPRAEPAPLDAGAREHST
ncbi:Sec-independent protein translocase protein TatB [uncultured Enterovirga sp.]|uniref:Sec-independent protein translocase protein TatB n=1 Tax=uncultured Enterovirga sp. TaxID=2026352 RepID=UPI0035CB0C9B